MIDQPFTTQGPVPPGMQSRGLRPAAPSRLPWFLLAFSGVVIALLVVVLGVYWFNSVSLDPTPTIAAKAQALNAMSDARIAAAQGDVQGALDAAADWEGEVADPQVLVELRAAAEAAPAPRPAAWGVYEYPIAMREFGVEHQDELERLEGAILKTEAAFTRLATALESARASHAQWSAAQG